MVEREKPWLPFPDPLGILEKATEDAPVQLRDPVRQILGRTSDHQTWTARYLNTATQEIVEFTVQARSGEDASTRATQRLHRHIREGHLDGPAANWRLQSLRIEVVRFIGACKVVRFSCETHNEPVTSVDRCPFSELTDEEWGMAWEVAQEAFPEGQPNPWVNGWWPTTLEEAEGAIASYAHRMRDGASRYSARMHLAAQRYAQSTEKAVYQYRWYVMREYEKGRTY